jgi:hypothetical protein
VVVLHVLWLLLLKPAAAAAHVAVGIAACRCCMGGDCMLAAATIPGPQLASQTWKVN